MANNAAVMAAEPNSTSGEETAAPAANAAMTANAGAWAQYAAALPQGSAEAMAAYWNGQNPYEAWAQQQQQQQPTSAGDDPNAAQAVSD